MSDSPSAVSEPSKNSVLVSFGGMLGLGACMIGMAIFLAGCAGFDKAFALAVVPLAMGGAGLLFTILGGVLRHGGVEDTPIVGGIFVNLFSLVGGLLLLALHLQWTILPVPGK